MSCHLVVTIELKEMVRRIHFGSTRHLIQQLPKLVTTLFYNAFAFSLETVAEIALVEAAGLIPLLGEPEGTSSDESFSEQ